MMRLIFPRANRHDEPCPHHNGRTLPLWVRASRLNSFMRYSAQRCRTAITPPCRP